MNEEDKLRLRNSLIIRTLVVLIAILLFGPLGVLRNTTMADGQLVEKSGEGVVQPANPGCGEYRDIELLRQRL